MSEERKKYPAAFRRQMVELVRAGRRSRRCHGLGIGHRTERSRLPDPLFQPNQDRRVRHHHMYHPLAPQFHEQQDVPHRVVSQGVGGQVHGPQLAGVTGQEGAPGGGGVTAVYLAVQHVPADRTGNVLHSQFRLEL